MATIQLTKEEFLQQAIDRFWETFPPVWNRVRSNLRSIATENFDISVEQFHILRHIRRGICSVSELAEVKQISRPAISQAVDLLVDKGLISRQQSAEDRRYVQLALTESGNELLNTIFQKNREWMMERMSSLSSKQLEEITHAMEIIKTTLEDESN